MEELFEDPILSTYYHTPIQFKGAHLMRSVSTLLSAAAGVALAVGLSPTANANLLAEFSTDGGATFTTLCTAPSGTSCSTTVNVPGGLDYTIFGATSNSPGTAPKANLLTSTVQLTNPEATDQTVEVLIGDTGFTMPSSPPNTLFTNSLSSTIVTGEASNTFTSIGCIAESNGQNVCPGNFSTSPISNDITGVGSSAASNNITIAALTIPYSMTEELKITLDPGANINFVASSSLTQVAIPEPSRPILAFIGLGLIGLGLRHKKTLKNFFGYDLGGTPA
jgi:hypothetical protein